MQPSDVIGIDLGTTNCALAYTRGEAVEHFPIPQFVHPGERREEDLLPSFLFLADDGPIVGVLAQRKGLENPGRLVASAKSWLSHSGVDRSAAILPVNAPDGVPRVFARAKWMIEKDRAFLMSMWLRAGPTVTFEEVDQEGTETVWVTPESMREYVQPLANVVNVFDRPDGYGDVLMYMHGYESFGIILYHYSAIGLIKTPVSIGDGC